MFIVINPNRMIAIMMMEKVNRKFARLCGNEDIQMRRDVNGFYAMHLG